MTIYFIVFQANFKEQFVPKLQQSVKNSYEGPLGLTGNGPKPSPVSLAWDFLMFNVSDLTFALFRKEIFCFSLNVAVLKVNRILIKQPYGIVRIHGELHHYRRL
jgi:hypothetical protein